MKNITIAEKCTCKYRKGGAILGLCFRCFKMCMDERSSAKHSLIQQIRETLIRKGLPSVRPEERYILHEIDGYNKAIDKVLSILDEMEKENV